MVKPRSNAFRLRGYVGLIVCVPALVAVAIGRPLFPAGTTPTLAMDLIGWVLFCCGVLLRFSSILFVGGRKGELLITDGPYAWCRNPLYLGSLCVALAAALMLHSIGALTAVIVLSLFYLTAVIPAEERQLQAAFPEEWGPYVTSVPRLLPRPRCWKAQYVQVEVRALRNESLRLFGMAFIPILARLLHHLRTEPWWPQLWLLP